MEKTHCFGLIAGYTGRGLKISLRDCLPLYQKEELTAAMFMKHSRRESGSESSRNSYNYGTSYSPMSCKRGSVITITGNLQQMGSTQQRWCMRIFSWDRSVLSHFREYGKHECHQSVGSSCGWQRRENVG
jgi:hypothetical protein